MQIKIKTFLYDPKPNIGWVHGFLACMGAMILAYLTTMILTVLITGDYAHQVIPAIITTPILISLYGMWILFSPNIITTIKKIIYLSTVFIFFLLFIIKVF